MSPLAWLAIPVCVTLAAAVAVPAWHSRSRRALSDEERAGVIGAALSQPGPVLPGISQDRAAASGADAGAVAHGPAAVLRPPSRGAAPAESPGQRSPGEGRPDA